MKTPLFVVTGSSRGIGRAITNRLLAEGYGVLGFARDHTHGPCHPNYHGHNIDLSDLNAVPSKLSPIAKRHPDVSGIISNAGSGTFGCLEQLSAKQIRSSIDLNLTSHLLVIAAFLPGLKKRGEGDIVIMGSESALQGGKQGTVYCAAKFGLRGFAQSLRLECSPSGVRVGIIHPGMVRTGFFDDLSFCPGNESHQAIEPDDVAEAVWSMVSMRRGTVLGELVMSPQTKVIQKQP